MIAGPQDLRHVPAGPAGADGHAVAEGLGQADHVGPDAGVLEAEPATGAGQAGLDLVGDHQHAPLVAQRSDPFEVAGRSRDHAALALYRLDEHGRHAGIERAGQRVEITEGHVAEAFWHGLERLVLGGLAGGGQGGQGPAVEAARAR